MRGAIGGMFLCPLEECSYGFLSGSLDLSFSRPVYPGDYFEEAFSKLIIQAYLKDPQGPPLHREPSYI